MFNSRTAASHARAFAATLAATVLSVTASCAVPPPSLRSNVVAPPGPDQTVPLRWPGLRSADLTAVHYGSGASQVADVYLPSTSPPRGVIVAVHGGGFDRGTRTDVEGWFGPVMAQTARGFAVVSVDYTLRSGAEGVFPAAVADVAAAVRWVRAAGPALGLNPTKVVLAGHSAGATIAALAALAANDAAGTELSEPAPVDAWVGFAGIYDFVESTPLVRSAGAMWLGPNAGDPRWFAAASPITHLDASDPPGFAVAADTDPIIPISQIYSLDAAAARAGASSKLWVDVVAADTVDRSGPTPTPCRSHTPMCGANAAALDAFLDTVTG